MTALAACVNTPNYASRQPGPVPVQTGMRAPDIAPASTALAHVASALDVSVRTINSTPRPGAGILALLLGAAVSWTAGIHDVLAPSPAATTAPVCGQTGCNTTAAYVYSNLPTQAMRFPSTPVTSSKCAKSIGLRCTTAPTNTPAGSILYGTVVRAGALNSCRCAI